MSTLTIPPVIPSPREDGIKLHKAFKGLGCDTSKVIKILSHRDVEQRSLIQQEYETNYSELLSKRISKELHGHVKKAMSLWLYDPPARDAKIARKALTTPVVDNQAITEVICSRTPSQIRRTKEVYLSTYHSALEKDIENYTNGDHKKAIKKETSGSFQSALLTILRCAIDPAMYFAKILRKSMKGVGTNDKRLIRIIVTRTEIDMCQIKIAYYKKYGKPLTHDVRSDTSGHYKDFLLNLIGSDY
ncbi:hypothetical protein Fmac_001831 [Flemingia macrophylla]|uniref:Annexin n=1 Tax=Flemingia macrophylla TaxID=520843 RepID=A0ABD1NI78_9FABA